MQNSLHSTCIVHNLQSSSRALPMYWIAIARSMVMLSRSPTGRLLPLEKHYDAADAVLRRAIM